MTSDSEGFAPPDARRGRGATRNPPGRYEQERRSAFDDGWGGLDEAPRRLRTLVRDDAARSILTRNEAPDTPFDRSVNPYRGCEHGCAYCYARPSHAWLGLSPGLDFETQIFARPGAPRLLAEALARPGYKAAPIAIGTVTDPYQPVERERRITQGLLEVLLEARHPAMILTKSALVLRDLNVLADMARLGLVRVGISITTLDHRLSRAMEPRAAAPLRRLEAMEALAQAGIPTMAMAAPMIFGLNDHELERILEAAAAAGASSAGYAPLRLAPDLKGIFADWLRERFPDKAARVMRLAEEARPQGAGLAARGDAAALLAQRFALAIRRHGLTERPALRSDLFRRPIAQGEQLSILPLLERGAGATAQAL